MADRRCSRARARILVAPELVGRLAARAAWLLLLAIVVAGAAGCRQVLPRQYEYEEDLHLSLDGSATLFVNASVPALVALRGLELPVSPSARLDRTRVRALYEAPGVHVVRVSTSRRFGRRFVHLRLDVANVRQLQTLAPFSWSAYRFDRGEDQYTFLQVVSGQAARSIEDVGWTGQELLAFRLHLPSKIRYHDAPSRRVERGNILIWEQPLAARLGGEPLHMEARMETQSILYTTISLFAGAAVVVVIVLAVLIWWLTRAGKGSEQAVDSAARAGLMLLVALAGATLAARGQSEGDRRREGTARPFSVVEASIADMRTAMEEHRVTSRDLVLQSLVRIATYEDRLNAVIAVNPKALDEADARDRERAAGHVRGPLHGIPIALKDNIHTSDLPTTGGALVFDGFRPPYEATLTSNLREAGAVILAKTGLTELANFVASGMPGNYNALTGYGMNPYDPRRDPRDSTGDGRPVLGTGGSSSGIGTAASFWAANVGTETSGSILSPANQNMLAAVKPTVGRISRYGVIPITADQDTAGPLARTVTDAAILLGVLEGGSPDPNDPATSACAPPPHRDYTQYLDTRALRGVRIGVPRAFYYDPVTPPSTMESRGGLNSDQARAMVEAIAILARQGAVIVDPANIPSVVATDPRNNFLLWPNCSGLDDGKGNDANCSVVMKYGMKRDFNAWLASLGAAAPVHSLTGLRQWNIAHEKAGAIKYGQAQLDISDEMDVEADRERYQGDRAKDLRLSAAEGIDQVMKAERLDALLFPAASGAALAAKPGYPTVIVPFAMLPVRATPSLPAGFDPKPAPYGVSFTGTACSEPRLLAIAYAFEQATKRRVPPASVP